ncbi:RasGAP C-terminus-domain-containing protein [Sporodiniella umbellata]|nr:RasGAP C-terminus-domain-containing protein [Sporodiniella umbellata]
MIGAPMPNFLSLSCSLFRDLDMIEDDENDNCLKISPTSFDLKTPELFIGGDDSDIESIADSSLKDEDQWSCPWFSREEHQKMEESSEFITWVTHLQSNARRTLSKKDLSKTLQNLSDCSIDFATQLQAQCRGYSGRLRQKELKKKYKSYLNEAIQVQDCLKTKFVNANNRLSNDMVPSPSAVKSFVHLLDENDLDFDREMELESLRQNVMECLRENSEFETHVTTLDTRISLLLKNNKKSRRFDYQTKYLKKKEKEQKWADVENTKPDFFSLTGSDRESKRKLDQFQNLVYVLQTEPQYAARLLSMNKRRKLGDRANPVYVESAVTSIFKDIKSQREEFLLLKLLKRCIMEEISHIDSPREFINGDFPFVELESETTNIKKERRFFKELFGEIIQKTIETKLMAIAEVFFQKISSTSLVVPYSIRMVAKELKKGLEKKFPNEPKEDILKIVGCFIYRNYLKPGLNFPEKHGLKEVYISPRHRIDIQEVSNMLQQIATGINSLGNERQGPASYQPFNSASKIYFSWVSNLIHVKEPEAYYNVNILNDEVFHTRPMVYLSPKELFHLQLVLHSNIDTIEPDGASALSTVIHDMGKPTYEAKADISKLRVRLLLSRPCNNSSADSEAQHRQLQIDAKRLVVYVLKVQSGPSLVSIFQQPITMQHEAAWNQLKQKEFTKPEQDCSQVTEKRRYLNLGRSNRIVDLQKLNFFQLKELTHRLVNDLKDEDSEPCDSHYQKVLTDIARDIIEKNTRRIEREQEIERTKQTLNQLKEKREFLTAQIDNFECYLNSCIQGMAETHEKNRPKFSVPFTKQYFHMRKLRKLNMVPKFGSYKYTVKKLFDRQVLSGITHVLEKSYDSTNIVLSMDQANTITVQANYKHWPNPFVKAAIKYDDLLQAQFEGIKTMSILDGMVNINVSTFILLLNKKYVLFFF